MVCEKLSPGNFILEKSLWISAVTEIVLEVNASTSSHRLHVHVEM
jgi:hypothetical protein